MNIVGDNTANVVQIGDNGAGALTISCDGSVATATGITHIRVDTNRGDDNFGYSLLGNRTVPLNLDVDLGRGSDSAIMSLADISSNMSISVKGRDGADHLEVGGIGTIASGARLDLQLDGGQGNDDIRGPIQPRLEILGELRIHAQGGEGDDTISIRTVRTSLAAGAWYDVRFDGGTGADRMSFGVNGEIDGRLDFRSHGNDGDDRQEGDFNLEPGSTGSLDAAVRGGEGNDFLSLAAFDSSGGAALVSALLDGGEGIDTCFATPNVRVRHCEV